MKLPAYFDESKQSLKLHSDETKDLPGIAILKRKRVKFQNNLGKHIATLAGIRGKLLIEKAG